MGHDPNHPKPPAPAPTRPTQKDGDDEISDEVLAWVSAGKDAHGCPACPHNGLGPAFQGGSHILVDGSIFQDGSFIRKL